MLATAVVVVALAVVLAGWAGVRLARDRAVVLRQLVAAGVVEVAIVVQVVVSAVLAAGGHALADAATFWGYLVVALLLLPAAAVWAFADRTRWSSAVLVAAGVTLAVMELRVLQLWDGAPAG